MTTPALAALRALMEAAQLRRNTGLRPLDEFMSPDDWVVIPHADFDEVRAALPAAREALERLGRSQEEADEYHQKLCLEIERVKELRRTRDALEAHVAQLKKALCTARGIVRHAQMVDPKYVEHYMEIEAQFDAALEGRDE